MPFRAFLEAMAKDPDTSRGGAAAYESLDATQRDAWIDQVEAVTRAPGGPIGHGVLALLGVETDVGRQRRLLACASEPPFALRRETPEGVVWRLVRPFGCELASVATVRLDASGSVQDAHYEPLAASAWSDGFEGAALAVAVNELAHAVVHHADALRSALLPFVDLFSPVTRRHEAAA